MHFRILASIVLTAALFACNNPKSEKTEATFTPSEEATYEVVKASEVEWTHLNPKRGDLAPKAGTLWGDRNSKEATGFLLKPTDGFSSPPHIHNVSYRGIVISGLIHNDDPNATDMWMPAGSFWTQPKGEVHITSAKGVNTLAYIEIDEGPYLVLPAHDHFDSGERPVNMDESNIVWVNANEIKWVDSKASINTKVAFLWGERTEGKLNGTLVKIPAGFKGEIQASGNHFRAVMMNGVLNYEATGKAKTNLETGSYFGSDGKALHKIENSSANDAVVYIRTNGEYKIINK